MIPTVKNIIYFEKPQEILMILAAQVGCDLYYFDSICADG